MNLSNKTTDAMKLAQSPEEAYKIFASAVSTGLSQIMADAIAKAIQNAAQTPSPLTKGWEQYVTGFSMKGDWGTPGLMMAPSIVNCFSNSVVAGPAGAHILGGSITVGGTWSF